MMSRILFFFSISILLAAVFPPLPATAQDADEEEDTIELLPPDYVTEQYGFGIALPEDYIAVETVDDEGRWYLNIVGEYYQPTALITAEALPEDIVDLAGFWQLMKERDPYMAQNITYEKVDSIADTGAVQSRVEKIEQNEYILAITWVFVKDGIGFTLSGYPASGGNYNDARDLALSIHDQFRWMAPEEIAENDTVTDEIELPEGREF